MTGLAPRVDELTLVGRLDPRPGRSHYALPESVGFVGLPWYSSLLRPGRVIGSLVESGRRFWRLLDDVDAVWLLGPYVHAILFCGLAVLRRRRVTLGVRQDFPAYVRSRHPNGTWIHVAADAMELGFRTLARWLPVAVVGPDLAVRYRHAKRVLELTVTLVTDEEIVDPATALARPRGEPRTVLSVGRLDQEKNPLLLADVLAGLLADGTGWRLLVVGDGPMRLELEDRLRELNVDRSAELLGYVPIDGGLLDLYRNADVLLHVSFTEGLPQVLFESFAAGTPVVATAVGGVAQAVGDAAVLIPPADAGAAIDAVRRVDGDPDLRARVVRAGSDRVRAHTLDAEARRLVAFLGG